MGCPQPVSQNPAKTYRLDLVTFSPDGQTLASASDDKPWDVSTGQCLRTLQDIVWSVASPSPQGTTLASGSTDRTIKLWDASSGECLKTLQDLTAGSGQLLLANGYLLSGSTDRTVKLWMSAAVNASKLCRDIGWARSSRSVLKVETNSGGNDQQ